MEQKKQRLRIITNYETILRESIEWCNSVYRTDFVFVEFIRDEVNFAIVEFENATPSQIFDLGRGYGGLAEAYDKRIATLQEENKYST